MKIKIKLLTYFLYSPMPCCLCTHTHICWKVSFFPPRYKKKVITRKTFRITHTTHNNPCRMNVTISVLHHHFHFRIQQKTATEFHNSHITHTCTFTEIYPQPLQSSSYKHSSRISHGTLRLFETGSITFGFVLF